MGFTSRHNERCCRGLRTEGSGLEVAQGLGHRLRSGFGVAGDTVGCEVSVAFERAADDVAGAQTNGEGEGEDDSSEEDSEGQLNDFAANLEMVEAMLASGAARIEQVLWTPVG